MSKRARREEDWYWERQGWVRVFLLGVVVVAIAVILGMMAYGLVSSR